MERNNRFIEMFKNSNLNQSQFAMTIGVTQSAVSKFINGRACPSKQTMLICEILYGSEVGKRHGN